MSREEFVVGLEELVDKSDLNLGEIVGVLEVYKLILVNDSIKDWEKENV